MESSAPTASTAPLPSALTGTLLDEMLKAVAGGRQPVFFLDYDGTLAPIVDEPDRAFISDQTRETVRRLAESQWPVGLISGRSNDKLRAFLQLDGVYLAGSHGVDVVGPSGYVGGPDPAQLVGAAALDALKAARGALDATLGDLPGYLTEDNVYCITAHYRMVDASQHDHVCAAVQSILAEHPCLKHKDGKMVHELRPAIDWDKGRAVEWLYQRLARGMSESDLHESELPPRASDVTFEASRRPRSLLPIYIGDDVADEDAFRAVARLGGIGIKVAEGDVAPHSTAATRSLTQPQVEPFLSRCLDCLGSAHNAGAPEGR
mmetsp:Transcript_37329/g.98754  ORF Transcript_37329/g.98754 Transcript_37329/m.98754 type:complete len:319 (+) Transcript_37329:44-1000(+)